MHTLCHLVDVTTLRSRCYFSQFMQKRTLRLSWIIYTIYTDVSMVTVNFIGQFGPLSARAFGQTFCCVFWVRVTFKWVDWVKVALHHWVGLTQSAEGLNRTKRLNLLWEGGFPPAQLPEQRHSVFPAFAQNLPHWLSWVSSLLTADVGTCKLP